MSGRTVVIAVLSLIFSSCASGGASREPCSVIDCHAAAGSVRNTKLEYTIEYWAEGYEVTATYDVLFLDGSSTNRLTERFQGEYGEIVESPKRRLRGKQGGITPGAGLTGWLDDEKVYFLKGIINEPSTDQIHQRNLKALSIQVEQHYWGSYRLK